MKATTNLSMQQALLALRGGNAAEAERLFRQVLKSDRNNIGALNLLGIVLMQLGRHEEAESNLRRALKVGGDSDATLYNHGIVLKALKRPAEALDSFSKALKLNAASPDTWNNRGTVFNDLKRYEEAIADFNRAISLKPDFADAFCNKGKSLYHLDRLDEAVAAYDQALALNPRLVEAMFSRALTLHQMQRHDEALAAYDQTVRLKPDHDEAWFGLGRILAFRGMLAQAEVAYTRVLAAKPETAAAWIARGDVRLAQLALPDAGTDYERAIALNPKLAGAWTGLGSVRHASQDYSGAVAALDRSMALDPDQNNLQGLRILAKLYLCDWADLDADVARLLEGVRSGKAVSAPFSLISIGTTLSDQLQGTSAVVSKLPKFPPLWTGERYNHSRIRVAYLSADMHDHPVGHLVAALFEQHDRTKFDVSIVSLGPDDGSAIRARLKNSAERFIDLSGDDDHKAASFLREQEFDIIVDLNLHTHGGRLGICSRRPAPIQVNYLGYAGTSGASFYDYILVDRCVVREEEAPFFTESPVWLPDSYMPSDRGQDIGGQTPPRSACGLPETGFVFCCFNNIYKIAPETFDIWMRLLRAVEGSVLWLSETNAPAKTNLRERAQKAGIAPERLIFAPRIPAMADHLARHRNADLFLDTLPYNAHATTAFSLLTGVPVLTRIGDTFAGRVAASLLQAAGMSELITSSATEYEALALKIAREPALASSLKDKLARHRTDLPTFDPARLTRHLEAAYATMWQRYQNGQGRAAFAVESQA